MTRRLEVSEKGEVVLMDTDRGTALTVGYMPGVGAVAPVGTHADFVRHQEARLLALWLGPPKTELGPDGSFIHTFTPGLGPGWLNARQRKGSR